MRLKYFRAPKHDKIAECFRSDFFKIQLLNDPQINVTTVYLTKSPKQLYSIKVLSQLCQGTDAYSLYVISLYITLKYDKISEQFLSWRRFIIIIMLISCSREQTRSNL